MHIIKNYDQLNTGKNRQIVLNLAESALDSIQPEKVLKKHFLIKNNRLIVQDAEFNLQNFQRIFLLGYGKGSAQNCMIIEEILGDRLTAGLVIDITSARFKKIKFTQGTHPLPSETNLAFTRKVTQTLSQLTPTDLVLVITCGGGSAMLVDPVNITLEKLVAVNRALLASGANIHDMNVIRKHLSNVKGGGLARILYPAIVINLIFSDVPGNDLTVIASGPTVPDPTTKTDAFAMYQKYLQDKVDLEPQNFTETPKDEKFFANVHNILFLSNKTALTAMQEKAQQLGIKVIINSDQIQGEARIIGPKLISNTPQNTILLAAGETTVTVKGKGAGGRNQELVLATLNHLDEKTTIAAFTSDGWDNSPFCGAIADITTLKKALDLNLEWQVFLNNNDSYNFFDQTGDGLITGRLGANVADLMIVYKI